MDILKSPTRYFFSCGCVTDKGTVWRARRLICPKHGKETYLVKKQRQCAICGIWFDASTRSNTVVAVCKDPKCKSEQDRRYQQQYHANRRRQAAAGDGVITIRKDREPVDPLDAVFEKFRTLPPRIEDFPGLKRLTPTKFFAGRAGEQGSTR